MCHLDNAKHSSGCYFFAVHRLRCESVGDVIISAMARGRLTQCSPTQWTADKATPAEVRPIVTYLVLSHSVKAQSSLIIWFLSIAVIG